MLIISKVETFYGNIQALRGVNVKVKSEEIVTLIGSNGAGKSTLLMTVSGVNKASTGEIIFNDKHIENLPPHDIVNLGISQVPEGRRIFSRLSVEDNLRLGASAYDKGKSFDTFAPIGPWLVTPDEIFNPQNLHLWLNVNGEKQQDGNTRDMIFSIRRIISTITSYMTLLPGDIIATGTPPGVGLGKIPPNYLKKGDVIDLGIEGLGKQCQKIKSWEEFN